MITKEQYIEICKSIGFHISDRSHIVGDDTVYAYFSNSERDLLVSEYLSGDIYVISDLICYDDFDGWRIDNTIDTNIKPISNEQVLEKKLIKLMNRYKSLKKKIRKKMIEKL